MSSNRVELALSPQVPHIHRVIITSSGHMVAVRERERESVSLTINMRGDSTPHPLGEKSMASTFLR